MAASKSEKKEPELNINTANDAGGNKMTEAQMAREEQDVAKILGEMKYVTVSIPKQFIPMLGESLPCFINGAKIVVPVDGEDHEIPEPYLEVIKNSLKYINSGDVRRDYNLGKDVDADALISVR